MRVDIFRVVAVEDTGAFSVKNRIRVLRAERNWSQAELAKRTGVSRNSINAVENGKFVPSLTLAFSIAMEFELSVEEVFDPESYRRG